MARKFQVDQAQIIARVTRLNRRFTVKTASGVSRRNVIGATGWELTVTVPGNDNVDSGKTGQRQRRIFGIIGGIRGADTGMGQRNDKIGLMRLNL